MNQINISHQQQYLQRQQQILIQFAQNFPFAKVLDVGCGELAFPQSIRFRNYLGIDHDDSAIQIAAGKRPDLSFINTSIDRFSDNQFDIVICLQKLYQQATETEYWQFLNQLISRSGQYLIIAGYSSVTNPQANYYGDLRQHLTQFSLVNHVHIVGKYKNQQLLIAYLIPNSRSIVKKKKAIVILGMHRSGTSALTRVFNLCGFALGKNLIPPQIDNQAGYWESDNIININDQILKSANSSWYDEKNFPLRWYQSSEFAKYHQQALKVLQQDLGDKNRFVLKDPRICRLLPFWLRVLHDFDCQTYGVIIVRHPLEVVASLHKRNRFTHSKILRLWLQHIISAENNSRHLHRFFLHYDDLLRDWRSVIDRFSQQHSGLIPNLSSTQAEKIDRFLNSDFRHHQQLSFDNLDANLSDSQLINQVKFVYNQFLHKIDFYNQPPLKEGELH